ncbi:hypothetical protein Acr_13g0014460 [Actinidia rufa]|uniref:Uncharacterized protein n=1 Tax=Actinidia rufa TaxID=165716 RepID=A0A7J0FNR9_9ERIC|nr:hypothetical protein Acr_13g0014460 [Actinidia rufa]
MQHRSSEHQTKHPCRVDTTEDFQIRVSMFEQMPRRLTDAPKYPDVYANHKKGRVVQYETNRYAREDNNKVYEEDVDAEADDFIKHEHKKFQLSKWMSENGA